MIGNDARGVLWRLIDDSKLGKLLVPNKIPGRYARPRVIDLGAEERGEGEGADKQLLSLGTWAT